MTSDGGHRGVAVTPPSDTAPSSRASSRPFTLAAWILLAYSAAVAVFGAFVRASLSGDGCGASWPLCDGQVLPLAPTAKMAVEFTHRVSSGLLILGLAGLTVWAYRAFRSDGHVWKAAGVALGTSFVSALIGALLVLFRWVTNDASAGRAVTMPLHLVNNLVLFAALALCAYWSAGGQKWAWKGQGQVAGALRWAAGGMVALGMTGAISAMGRTAFEHELKGASTLVQRLMLHVGEGAHPLLRGGVVHPLIATSVGLLIVWACGLVVEQRPRPEVRFWARATVGLFLFQFVFGLANLLMSAPVGMQLAHLALAIGNWLTLTMLAAHALVPAAQVGEASSLRAEAPAVAAGGGGYMALAKDYVALTKPRVVSLLLFTTVAAMIVAARGWPGGWLILAVSIGGYLMAGAANAFNMSVEEDLDLAMERTAKRPTVTHRIGKRQAQAFAWVTMTVAFAVLWSGANLLSAALALCGLLCYVFVYTLWLKRRTWHNIVIGGAAGAFPPLVGYAAVSGALSPLAWTLFAVIFTWTPVHFWALALLLKDDYARAGVPMLPVVKGERVTAEQIGIYAVLTSLVCVVPFVQGQAGLTYLAGSVLLNLGLLAQSLRLFLHTDRPHARALFKFSMAYLALFFIVVAVDQAARWPA
ncbi:MAG: heme o synthase [Fimbriimonadaceae bacterium]|nr:heme o synthase [Fimbriimonadaceae bacterium]QYK56419.1 MAG: heme o synthase [Fimbriimonadaceae bacterium]